jgi:hypothetical protein
MPKRKTTQKRTAKKRAVKADALEAFEFTLPVREQVVEDMYEENLERDKKRSQLYIV